MSLAAHPKLAKLARQLRVSRPAAIGHLHLLWWWCIQYRSNGDLSRDLSRDIADAAGWTGDPERFRTGLLDSGFLDPPEAATPGHLHDWDIYTEHLQKALLQKAEGLARRREADRDRQKRHRQQAAEKALQQKCGADFNQTLTEVAKPETHDVAHEASLRHADGNVTVTLRHGSPARATVPNLTIPSPIPLPGDEDGLVDGCVEGDEDKDKDQDHYLEVRQVYETACGPVMNERVDQDIREVAKQWPTASVREAMAKAIENGARQRWPYAKKVLTDKLDGRGNGQSGGRLPDL